MGGGVSIILFYFIIPLENKIISWAFWKWPKSLWWWANGWCKPTLVFIFRPLNELNKIWFVMQDRHCSISVFITTAVFFLFDQIFSICFAFTGSNNNVRWTNHFHFIANLTREAFYQWKTYFYVLLFIPHSLQTMFGVTHKSGY